MGLGPDDSLHWDEQQWLNPARELQADGARTSWCSPCLGKCTIISYFVSNANKPMREFLVNSEARERNKPYESVGEKAVCC